MPLRVIPDATECHRDAGATTKAPDIFEDIRRMLGCRYESDLRFEPYLTRAKRALLVIDTKRYPMEQSRDLKAYLYGEQTAQTDHRQAKAYSQQKLIDA